ncbi:hypothetical protein HMPREF9713_01132 [Myroides odoratimimus CCUG 12700]|nr:hypothetical protein HMPREF9713_01132 [Myroides odoratimimus CCUG 12700]
MNRYSYVPLHEGVMCKNWELGTGTENGEQGTENRKRRTGNGEQKTGNRKQETGNGKQETENRKRKTENRKLGIGNGEQETENGEQETGNSLQWIDLGIEVTKKQNYKITELQKNKITKSQKMAYLDNKGMLHGKCGNKVYAVRNKKQIVRDLPKKASKPPSEAQIIQRKKFGKAVKISSAFKPFFQLFSCAYQKNGIGKFTAHILCDILLLQGNKICADFSRLILLKGILCPHQITSITSNFTGTLSLEWITNVEKASYYNPTVKIGLVVYNHKIGQFQHIHTPELSGKEQAIYRLDEVFTGLEVHCWYYCYVEGRNRTSLIKDTQYSMSMYLGKIRV